jgi:hypothetical protein
MGNVYEMKKKGEKASDNKQLPYSLNKCWVSDEENGRARMMNGVNNNEKKQTDVISFETMIVLGPV